MCTKFSKMDFFYIIKMTYDQLWRYRMSVTPYITFLVVVMQKEKKETTDSSKIKLILAIFYVPKLISSSIKKKHTNDEIEKERETYNERWLVIIPLKHYHSHHHTMSYSINAETLNSRNISFSFSLFLILIISIIILHSEPHDSHTSLS